MYVSQWPFGHLYLAKSLSSELEQKKRLDPDSFSLHRHRFTGPCLIKSEESQPSLGKALALKNAYQLSTFLLWPLTVNNIYLYLWKITSKISLHLHLFLPENQKPKTSLYFISFFQPLTTGSAFWHRMDDWERNLEWIAARWVWFLGVHRCVVLYFMYISGNTGYGLRCKCASVGSYLPWDHLWILNQSTDVTPTT